MIPQSLLERFTHPEAEFGPVPAWWWSGETVTADRLRWQLAKFLEGGIRNLVVINLAPAGPNYGAIPDDPAWFSEQWWERFTLCCDIAAEHGMRIWFYDQIGFSGANLQGRIRAEHPWAAGRGIASSVVAVGDDGLLPDLGESVLAVYEMTIGGWRTVAHEHAHPLRPGARVQVITTHETAFDYLNPDAFALLLDYVHGEFERRLPHYIGTVIAGSFQDEFPAAPSWSADFAEKFQEFAGYDLLDELPALWEGTGPRAAKVRVDYERVRSRLFQEAVFIPLARWHDARSMLIGADQMNPARAGFPLQGVQLYADYLATHRWFNAAGSDHQGDARVHSSLADLYDHRRVWLEAFHSSGWGGTLEDTWDWLIPFFRSGATAYNPHAAYYATKAGWFEWAPPGTDFRQPYYALYPEFAAAIQRVCSTMTWGRHAVEVGVLYPSTTMQALLPIDAPIRHFGDGVVGGPHGLADETQQTYLSIVGVNDWFDTRPGVLDEAGIDFDVLDEDSLERSDVVDGVLTINGFDFRTVILPSTDHLLTTTAERLIDLLDTGGRVIVVGRAPRWAAGVAGRDGVVVDLLEHPRLEVAAEVGNLAMSVATRRTPVTGPLPAFARTTAEGGVAFVGAAFPNASGYPLQGGVRLRWKDHDFDPARYQASTYLDVASDVVGAEIWNPATGERRPAQVRREGEFSRITVDFEGAPAVLVAWGTLGSSADGSRSAPTPAPLARENLGDGWRGDLVPTLDNRWADFEIPASSAPLPLSIRKLKTAEGTVKVGYGQEVLVSEPFTRSSRVEALSAPACRAVLDGTRELGEGDAWKVHTYSLSMGIDRDFAGQLGPKGAVPCEFVRHDAAGEGEHVAVRAIIRLPSPGDYELTIGASASKRAWVNGVELGGDTGYTLVAPVTLTERIAVLEYHLGAEEGKWDPVHGGETPTTSSFFAFDRAGTRVGRPEFIRAPKLAPPGDVRYRTMITLDREPVRVRAIIGAAVTTTLELDGAPVARQERVEVYQSEWGGKPAFFEHILSGAGKGEHELALVAHSSSGGDEVYLDLLVEFEDGRRDVYFTDPSWTVDGAPAIAARRRSRNLSGSHAALRPHPLPLAHWLSGPPQIGVPSEVVEATTSLRADEPTFEVLLPAGATSVSLPAHVVSAALDGHPSQLRADALHFEALPAPAVMRVTTAPDPFARGGAAWHGPLVVETHDAPISLGSWSDLGLGSWSGGVRYHRDIRAGEGERLRLDLGRVRGAVRVELDGREVGAAFCAPYRFDFACPTAGEHQLSVTVYNTLAPRLDSFSPTRWIYPSQLVSGILGPVELHR